MQKEATLVLIVLLLVVLPTSILSIFAARSIRSWEAVQEQQQLRAARQVAESIGRTVATDVVERAHQFARAVARGAEDRGESRSVLAMAAGLRGAAPGFGGAIVSDAQGLAYPPRESDLAIRAAARSRWVLLQKSYPELTALDAARAYRARDSHLENALREYRKVLELDEAPPEFACEAALGVAACARRMGRLEWGIELARGIADGSRWAAAAAVAGEPVRHEELRDEEGYLYQLEALRMLVDLGAGGGAERQLLERVVHRYGDIISAQRTALLELLADWPAPAGDARARELLSWLDERRSGAEMGAAARADLERGLASLPPPPAGPAGSVRSIPGAGGVYVLSAIPGGWAGFLVSGAAADRLARSIVERSGAAARFRVAVGDADAAPEEPRLVDELLPAPLDSFRIAVHPVAGADGPRSGHELQARLYAWGVFLLGVVVAAGSWLVLRRVSVEIRQARARTDFVALVSHELRTPLASMKMLAESLYLGNIRDPEKRKKSLEIVIKETDRLWSLVERVLFFVRLDQDAVVYHRREEPSADLVEGAVQAFRGRQWNGRATIDLEIASPLPPVNADRTAIEQVLLNLMDNAVKYSSGPAAVHVRAEPSPDRRWIRISVRDEGVGMERRELKRIFRKFYRVGGSRAAVTPGVGLGLALCRHVVRAHGGRIEVESEAGVGSTFTVCLKALPGGSAWPV